MPIVSIIVRASMLAALAGFAHAASASQWLTVAKDRLRVVELDRDSVLQSDSGTKVAWGRIVLSDAQSRAAGYRSVRALNRYNCVDRSFLIVKRVYLADDGRVLREENVADSKPLRIRVNTVDERFFNEVCKPPSLDDLRVVAEKAAEKAAEKGKETEAPAVRHADMRLAGASEPKSAKPYISLPPLPSVTPASAPAAAAAPPETAAAPAPVRKPRPVTETRHAAARPALPLARSASLPPMPHAEHWGYTGTGGPEHWGKLDPDFAMCANGQRQSPIDIRDGIKVEQEVLQFDYKPSFFRIVDNGHTIQINYGRGSTLRVMGRSYELQQFHFHRPSEERIDGKAFDMVAHLVHKDPEGRLAVLAVLIERGTEHPLIQTLWNNLPLEKHEEYQAGMAINVADLLPARREYFSYMGSLTTPPCSEGVLWLVMKQPVQLTAEQIAVFARFYENNARPVQPLAGRVIKESR